MINNHRAQSYQNSTLKTRESAGSRLQVAKGAGEKRNDFQTRKGRCASIVQVWSNKLSLLSIPFYRLEPNATNWAMGLDCVFNFPPSNGFSPVRFGVASENWMEMRLNLVRQTWENRPPDSILNTSSSEHDSRIFPIKTFIIGLLLFIGLRLKCFRILRFRFKIEIRICLILKSFFRYNVACLYDLGSLLTFLKKWISMANPKLRPHCEREIG